MGRFFLEGGFGMYPTMLFGFFLVAVGATYALRPDARWLRPLKGLGLLTFGSGVLGATMGLINTLKYVAAAAPEARVEALCIGTAESLNNVILALVFVVLVTLIASVGNVRGARIPAA